MSAERSEDRIVTPVDRVRGGVSLWSILSGILVAFGAFVVLSAIVGAILSAAGVAEGGIRPDDMQTAGISAGIGLIIVQFLSYMWGGYTAGRMARGSGWINGLLVAVGAIVLVIILGAILAGMIGPAAEGQVPPPQTLPLPLSELRDIATGVGLGILAAMLLGGAAGGMLGARWHTRLENRETAARSI